MNNEAIDAGVKALHRVEVPAEWATTGFGPRMVYEGKENDTPFITNILRPMAAQKVMIYQFQPSRMLKMVHLKMDLLLTKREPLLRTHLSGKWTTVFNVTSVPLYVHTQLLDLTY